LRLNFNAFLHADCGRSSHVGPLPTLSSAVGAQSPSKPAAGKAMLQPALAAQVSTQPAPARSNAAVPSAADVTTRLYAYVLSLCAMQLLLFFFF